MTTREQIKAMLDKRKAGRAVTIRRDEDVEIMGLALAYLDSERARRVGEAVIASGVTAEWCAKHLRDLRNARGSMSLSSPAYGRAFTQEIALFGALVPALRGEP